jgi:hypothetical protein
MLVLTVPAFGLFWLWRGRICWWTERAGRGRQNVDRLDLFLLGTSFCPLSVGILRTLTVGQAKMLEENLAMA